MSTVEKVKKIVGVVLALGLSVAAGIMANMAIEAEAANGLDEATQCTFIVPPDFAPGEEAGLFINKSFPMESSSIKFSFYDNGENKVLTNREKIERENATFVISDMSENLTKEIYQSTMLDAYNQNYGSDVGFTVDSFNKTSFDGFPGYHITSEFQIEEQPRIHQTVYIILSKYRTFTVTYQRAEDDECEDEFKESAATIHVR